MLPTLPPTQVRAQVPDALATNPLRPCKAERNENYGKLQFRGRLTTAGYGLRWVLGECLGWAVCVSFFLDSPS